MPKFNNGESAASVRQKINDAIDKVDGVQAISDADITGGTIDNTVIGGVTPVAGTFTNLTANTDLTINSTTTVTAILDEDNMASDSATALATQQSIKAYVDSQVTAQDLDFAGDTGTGAIDLDSQVFTVAGTANQITTVASGQNITISLPATISTTTADLTNVEVTNIKAKDGTAAATIADVTGVVTIPSAVLTTADINGGTIDSAVIGGTTPAAGTFSSATVNGNITVTGTVDGYDVSVMGDKLETIEENADVTDTANVTAAGALMDSELTNEAAVKALNQGVATTDSPTFAALDVNGTVTAAGIGVFGSATSFGATATSAYILRTGGAGAAPFAIAGSLVYHPRVSTIEGRSNHLFYTGDPLALRQNIAPNGDISFYEDTGTTPKFFWDASAEALGIGTTSPAADLHILSSAPAIRLTDAETNEDHFIEGSGSNLVFYADRNNETANSTIRFSVDNSEKMRITSAGLVGINTTSPSKTLDVVGDIGASGAIETSTRLTSGGTGSVAYTSLGQIIAKGTGNSGIVIDSGATSLGRLAFGDGALAGYVEYAHSDDSMRLSVNGSERLRITSSGLVGIGTSSPSSLLHVNGSTTLGGNVLVGGQLQSLAGAATYIDFGTAGQLSINTAGSERMRITSAGNVGIGTSSPAASLEVGSGGQMFLSGASTGDQLIRIGRSRSGSGNSYLDLVGDTTYTNFGLRFLRNAGANASSVLWHRGTGELKFLAQEAGPITLATSGTERMRIDSSGNLLVGKTAATISTDGAELRPTGEVVATTNGLNVAYFNRRSSDGSIAEFRKDGTTVGSIGSISGLVSYMVLDPRTGGVGLTGSGTTGIGGAIIPTSNAGAVNDGVVSVGDPAFRFKDLYLSGGVYVGGTGAANYLDDYEEGTWTPAISSGITSPTYSVQNGTYTKVGRLVTYSLRLALTAGTAAASILQIGGLPFSVASTPRGMAGSIAYAGNSIISSTTDNLPVFEAGAGSTVLSFYRTDGNQFLGTNLNSASTFYIDVGGQYFTN